MGVRNCQELGINLQKICDRLLHNDELVKLLYYTHKDPYGGSNLNEEEKKKILHNLIRVIPKVGTQENSHSVIVVYIPKASMLGGNSEFININIEIDVLVPLDQWIIKDSNLRPFAILGQIQNSLKDKTVNGLGKITGGDFDLVSLTDEMSVYRQTYTITEYA